MMRVKGVLEISAALSETILYDMFECKFAMTIEGSDHRTKKQVRMAFRTGKGVPVLKQLAGGEIDLGWTNPCAGLAMAVRGTGPFNSPLPLRAIAVFPSWDRLVFAVNEETGLTSLADIPKKKPKLRISTSGGIMDSIVTVAVSEVAKAYGFSMDDIIKWGGSIHVAPRPGHPDRIQAIRSGAANAVFDEGFPLWGKEAVAKGMRLLHVDEEVLRHMESLGFRRAPVPKSLFPDLREDVMTVDYSGWPISVHAQMPDEVAYAVCEAIESRNTVIPVDQEKSLSMSQLCQTTDAAPLDFPLHSGAEKYYREKGHLQ